MGQPPTSHSLSQNPSKKQLLRNNRRNSHETSGKHTALPPAPSRSIYKHEFSHERDADRDRSNGEHDHEYQEIIKGGREHGEIHEERSSSCHEVQEASKTPAITGSLLPLSE